jgi:hypothetical protein
MFGESKACQRQRPAGSTAVCATFGMGVVDWKTERRRRNMWNKVSMEFVRNHEVVTIRSNFVHVFLACRKLLRETTEEANKIMTPQMRPVRSKT